MITIIDDKLVFSIDTTLEEVEKRLVKEKHEVTGREKVLNDEKARKLGLEKEEEIKESEGRIIQAEVTLAKKKQFVEDLKQAKTLFS